MIFSYKTIVLRNFIAKYTQKVNALSYQFFRPDKMHTQKRFPGDDGVAGDLSFRLQCLVAFEVAVQLIVG